MKKEMPKYTTLFGLMSILMLMVSSSPISFGQSLSPPLTPRVSSTDGTGNENVETLLAEGAMLMSAKNYTGANKLYESALAIEPNNINAIMNKGVGLARSGNTTGAIEVYDRALTIVPNNINVLANKGIALARSGNTTGAIPL